MLLPFQGKMPHLEPKAFAFPTAALLGQVELKEYASVWPNVTLRGDVSYIEVGRYSNIQDNACLHVDGGHPCIIGDYVTVGHTAIVHGATVEDDVLIGMGAKVLTGAHIGKGSIIGAGALVRENEVIPPYSLVVGMPGRVIRTDEAMIAKIHNQALKYKMLWTEEYGFLPDAGGESFDPNLGIV